MDIPDDVQRRIAKFTPEALTAAARKHRLFRRTDMARKQTCTCLCLAPDARSTQCTIIDGAERVVQRETSELCKAVCFSRSPVRMLLRLVRRIVQFCDARHAGERSLIRVTLQVDPHGERRRRADRPYLLNACLDQLHHTLEIDFDKDLDQDTHDLSIEYEAGDAISEDQIPADVRANANESILEANEKPASLVIVAPDMSPGDFTLGQIRFRDQAHYWRAEPVFVYSW